MGLAERLDGLISVVAPTWAAERTAARLAASEAERLSNYRGSQSTRLDRPMPAARGASPDVMTERDMDRRDLVDRARQLERSSVLAEGMLSRTQESVVGNGFALQCKSADAEWNKATEAAFKAWAADADVRGLCSFGEMLGLLFRSYLRDGDVAAVKLASGHLRLVESDEIATPQGFVDPNMVDGVELNAVGRPIRFHITQQPRTLMGDRRSIPNHVPVPAEDVLFLARRRRAGQTRGVSAFAGVTWILDQIDGNIEAVTVAARMSACFGLVIKRKNHSRGMSTETGPDGVARRKLRVEPGAFFEVDIDEDVKPVQGMASPGTNFSEFIRTLGRIASVSFGLPIEILMMDFEKTNYSNARAAMLQAWKVWRNHQDMLKAFCSDVFAWWVLREMSAGTIPVREDALAHGWIAPGWQWIDPVNEIQATLASIDSGLQTRAEALMKLGIDPEEQYAQIAKEQPIARRLGIDAHSTLTRDRMAPAEPTPPGA